MTVLLLSSTPSSASSAEALAPISIANRYGQYLFIHSVDFLMVANPVQLRAFVDCKGTLGIISISVERDKISELDVPKFDSPPWVTLLQSTS